MLKIFQHTIKDKVSFSGVGLHSGVNTKVTILPGKEDQGFIFKRIDLKENNLVSATFKNVSSAKLCTTLKNKFGIKVSTVEHLLAALYFAEIDNAIIEIDNEEVPIMDGSAKDFLKEIKRTGIRKQSKPRQYIKILNKVELVDGERKISIEPNDLSMQVDFQLNYENKLIKKQKNSINFQSDYLERIIESRTFCLFEDIEKIQKIGLAKGGSLDNALVVKKEKVLNKGGLRNPKEFVNHKILDLAGDFLLSGYRVLGRVYCYQGGHELTNMFLRKLFNSKVAFTKFNLKDVVISKKIANNHPVNIAVNA